MWWRRCCCCWVAAADDDQCGGGRLTAQLIFSIFLRLFRLGRWMWRDLKWTNWQQINSDFPIHIFWLRRHPPDLLIRSGTWDESLEVAKIIIKHRRPLNVEERMNGRIMPYNGNVRATDHHCWIAWRQHLLERSSSSALSLCLIYGHYF